GPADMGGDLPVVNGCRVDAAAGGGLVAAIEGRARGDAPGLAIDGAEAPASSAEPADVGHRVAPGGEFPIEDGGEPVLVDEVVAGAEVLMDEHDLARRPAVQLQPAQAPFQDRVGIAEFVEVAAVELDAIETGTVRRRRQEI